MNFPQKFIPFNRPIINSFLQRILAIFFAFYIDVLPEKGKHKKSCLCAKKTVLTWNVNGGKNAFKGQAQKTARK